MQPRPSAEISGPFFPSCRFFMTTTPLSLHRARDHGYRAHARTRFRAPRHGHGHRRRARNARPVRFEPAHGGGGPFGNVANALATNTSTTASGVSHARVDD